MARAAVSSSSRRAFSEESKYCAKDDKRREREDISDSASRTKRKISSN